MLRCYRFDTSRRLCVAHRQTISASACKLVMSRVYITINCIKITPECSYSIYILRCSPTCVSFPAHLTFRFIVHSQSTNTRKNACEMCEILNIVLDHFFASAMAAIRCVSLWLCECRSVCMLCALLFDEYVVTHSSKQNRMLLLLYTNDIRSWNGENAPARLRFAPAFGIINDKHFTFALVVECMCL